MRRVVLVPVTLVLVLAGLLTTSALLWLDDRESVDRGALVAARQGAVSFFSLDYRHAGEDVDRVLSQATGDFKEEYAEKRDEVVDGVEDTQLVVSATVPEDGLALEYLLDDEAKVLVAVDVNTQSPDGAEDARYRTRVELRKVDGRWLVAGVEQVG